jgi:hypothetical protein
VQSELFEWDDDKATSNFRKHRVSFLEAASVFDDPFVMVEPDKGHSEQEIRWNATGFSSGSRVLLVVHAERRESIRLISARKATREERRRYDAQFE